MHELKQPIEYRVDFMDVTVRFVERKAGVIGQIISDGNEKRFVEPSDDYNLSRLMGAGYSLIGRGVLVEAVWSDEWFVAWRPYSPAPEVVPWER